jgi:cysteine-S-conjugate beta-lyase
MYNFDEAVDRVSEKCRKWDKSIVEKNFGPVPDDFIPMWIADMDFKIPKEIEEAFSEAVKRGIFGYTYCYKEFYDAVIEWQRIMHQVEVEKEWITLTYGTVSTIHNVIQTFCKAGDYVIMNTPVYDPFDEAAKRQGVNRVYNSLIIKDNRYFIDFESLKQQLLKYKPKLFLFCSPHNPSGRIWSIKELEEVIELCRETNTILVADEVHAEHIHYGEFTSILKTANHNNLILLTSPNKGFNLGGLKTSYSIIANEGIRTCFRKKLEQNSITSPNVFGVIGLIAAYNKSKQWLKEVSEYIKGNYELFKSYTEEHIPGFRITEMESSYLLWVDITKTKLTSAEITKLLAAKAGVLVENGAHFVNNGEGYIRINLGTQRANVLEALRRIERVMKEICL